jgi:hypothetical protein
VNEFPTDHDRTRFTISSGNPSFLMGYDGTVLIYAGPRGIPSPSFGPPRAGDTYSGPEASVIFLTKSSSRRGLRTPVLYVSPDEAPPPSDGWRFEGGATLAGGPVFQSPIPSRTPPPPPAESATETPSTSQSPSPLPITPLQSTPPRTMTPTATPLPLFGAVSTGFTPCSRSSLPSPT